MYYLSKKMKALFCLSAAFSPLFVPSTSYADEATYVMGEASYSPEERLYEGTPCSLTAEWVVLSAAALNNHFQEPSVNWWYQKQLYAEDLAWIKTHAISDHDLTLQTKIGATTKYSTDNAELEGIMYARYWHMNEAFIRFHSVIRDQVENISCILRPDTYTIVHCVNGPDQTKTILIMHFSPVKADKGNIE